MVLSPYLGFSLLSCRRVPGCVHYAYKKAWFGQKGLIIDRTLTRFILCMDVTLSVYVGPGLFLHSKRVFRIWVCMYKKHRVDWKGLTIFNNQISFLSNESVNFQLCYQIVPASVPWIQFLTLWNSSWMCGLYLQGIVVWWERVNYWRDSDML